MGKKIIRWLVFFFVFAILGTLFFRWWFGNQLNGLDNVEVWAIALDITLAHIVITFPLFVLSIFLFILLALLLFFLFLYISDFVSRKFIKQTKKQKANSSDPCCSIFLYTIIVIYGLFRFDKFLLVDTIDLQKIMFGAYDSSIGFAYPTTYRFTFIVDRFQPLLNSISTNPTLSKIYIALVAIFVALAAVVSFWKVIDFLIEKLNKKK